MSLLTYRNSAVKQLTLDDRPTILKVYTEAVHPISTTEKDRQLRIINKLVDYYVPLGEVYGVFVDDRLHAFVILDTETNTLEHLYSASSYYNIPVGVLMNYVLNYVMVGKQVMFYSKDTTTFKSLVEKLPITDTYLIKDSFREFVKRYQDGQQ